MGIKGRRFEVDVGDLGYILFKKDKVCPVCGSPLERVVKRDVVNGRILSCRSYFNNRKEVHLSTIEYMCSGCGRCFTVKELKGRD